MSIDNDESNINTPQKTLKRDLSTEFFNLSKRIQKSSRNETNDNICQFGKIKDSINNRNVIAENINIFLTRNMYKMVNVPGDGYCFM